MEQKSTFGKFIKQKRQEMNLTQKELADRLYVTESAVSKWERAISYPDITLVSAICEVLQISEHELVTASEDFKQREIEKQAKKYRHILTTYKWVFIGLYGIALLTCFICNLAVDHALSWFFVVLTAIGIAFSFTTVPVLVDKRRGLWVLGSFYVTLNLLLLTCRILFGGNWFAITVIAILFGLSMVFLPYILAQFEHLTWLRRRKGLCYFIVNSLLLLALEAVALYVGREPLYSYKTAFFVTVFCLGLAWVFFLVIRYARINALFKTAICLTLSGLAVIIVNPLIQTIVDGTRFAWQPVNLQNWSSSIYLNGNTCFLTMLGFLLAALLFTAGGIFLHLRKTAGDVRSRQQ